MNIFDQLLADNQIPKFVRVRHEMDRGHIDDIEGAVAQACLLYTSDAADE